VPAEAGVELQGTVARVTPELGAETAMPEIAADSWPTIATSNLQYQKLKRTLSRLKPKVTRAEAKVIRADRGILHAAIAPVCVLNISIC